MMQSETTRSAESIRNSYLNSNFDPETKALDRGSEALRDFYNSKNKRRKIGNWLHHLTKFKPVIK